MAIKIKCRTCEHLRRCLPKTSKVAPSVSCHCCFGSTRRKIQTGRNRLYYSPPVAAGQKSAKLMRRKPENRREQRVVRQEADTESQLACVKRPTLRGSHRAGERRGRAAKEQHKSGRTEGDRTDTGWVAPCPVARSAGEEEGDCAGDPAPGKSRRGSGESPASERERGFSSKRRAQAAGTRLRK